MDGTGAYRPGLHLLADLRGGPHLDDAAAVERALRAGARAAGATVLMGHVHPFPGAAGVTGVLLLAESHVSIHTWPEWGYAALDVFMCGAADAEAAVAAIAAALGAEARITARVARGPEAAYSNQRAQPAS